jgi:hypothetical protein
MKNLGEATYILGIRIFHKKNQESHRFETNYIQGNI